MIMSGYIIMLKNRSRGFKKESSRRQSSRIYIHRKYCYDCGGCITSIYKDNERWYTINSEYNEFICHSCRNKRIHCGKVISEEQRTKHRIRMSGKNNHNYGGLRNEHKENIRKSKLGKKIEQLSGSNNPMYGRIGDKSPNWKGGSTKISQSIRNSYEYKDWRFKCMERDDFTCRNCGDSRGGNLEVNHIIPLFMIIQEKNIKNIQDARNCEILWNVTNGETLCIKCHSYKTIKLNRERYK